MTKEEFIRKAIENRKNGRGTVCFDMDCDRCLYVNVTGSCAIGRLKSDLIDHIINLEAHKETNLEHYFKNATFKMTRDKVVLESNYTGDRVEDVFIKINGNTVQWLLAPYEEPKPKYKLSRFEYDLLNVQSTRWYYLNSLGIFERLIAKGYYKDIPTDVTIGDILENAEVIDGETD